MSKCMLSVDRNPKTGRYEFTSETSETEVSQTISSNGNHGGSPTTLVRRQPTNISGSYRKIRALPH